LRLPAIYPFWGVILKKAAIRAVGHFDRRHGEEWRERRRVGKQGERPII
jgi:hypothetical protein